MHPQLSKSPKPTGGADNPAMDTDDFLQDNECLPAENVAVIDELMSEEKLENLRAMVSGNVRKKLYFNPAYFEPHLLAVSCLLNLILMYLRSNGRCNPRRNPHKRPLSFCKRSAR